jgi:ferredoxin-NADP reductase/ferredoxin
VGQRALLRNYSLSGPPGSSYYRVTVKHEKSGVVSGYLHTRIAVGDQLDVAAPRGTFILDETQVPVLLISAGIGATPVLAMLEALAQQRSDREIWWLQGARDGRERPFASETPTLLASLSKARSRVYFSRPGRNDLPGRDFDSAGRLNAAVLAELQLPSDAEAYVCGPAAFMDEISAGLVALGFDADRIHTEPFGPAAALTPGIVARPGRAPHAPAGRSGDGPKVSFARSDLMIPWSDDYGSLLELAESCDVPVRWSCRAGVCQTCETTLIAGSVDYNPDPVEAPADGSVFICCSRPRDEIILDL